MGVRDTSQLVRAALLTVALTLAGPIAAASGAHGAGRGHHRGKHRHSVRHGRRHGVRSHVHTRPASKTRGLKTAEPSEAPTRRQSAVNSTAATIAEVLATPCQNTEITPEPANIAAAREAVQCLVNHERAEHSLAPLKINAKLEAAAEDHNAEMIQLDYFAHVAPDGETPVERIKKTGYVPSEEDGYVIGENLAWGTYALSTPKSIVEAWIASPGHLANILESRYTETGIGIVPAVPQSLGEGNPGATYAQEFGVIVE